AGLAGQINTVMQVCFFALTNLLPLDDAVAAVKEHVERAYGRRGGPIVEANLTAIDAALGALEALRVPAAPTSTEHRRPLVPDTAPDFVQRVTARMLAGEGDLLPVSALPVDGTFPTGTAKYEKRAIAQMIPVWDSSICIDCGKCAIVCPHATIRMKVFPTADLAGAPDGFKSKDFRSRDLLDHRL